MNKNYTLDLSIFGYISPNDPQIEQDIKQIIDWFYAFNKEHKGNVIVTLEKAVKDLENITMLVNRVINYLDLLSDQDTSDKALAQRVNELYTSLTAIEKEQTNFFNKELAAIPLDRLDSLITSSSILPKYRVYIDTLREIAKYTLSEEEEKQILSDLAASQFREISDEHKSAISKLRIKGEYRVIDMLMRIRNEANTIERYQLQHEYDTALGTTTSSAAKALNILVETNYFQAEKRGVSNPMYFRNLSNGLSYETVEAFHAAVGSPKLFETMQAFYAMKANYIGVTQLHAADRMVLLPLSDMKITLDEAIQITLSAIGEFSPTMQACIKEMLANGWFDPLPGEHKHQGGYNKRLVLPGNKPISVISLNYKEGFAGMTVVSHEFGHSAHALLTGKELGPILQFGAKSTNEVASIFAEMLVFDAMRRVLYQKGDKKLVAELLINKLSSMFNMVVHSVAASNFERWAFGMQPDGSWQKPGARTAEEYSNAYIAVMENMYGNIFDFTDAKNAWTYAPQMLEWMKAPNEFQEIPGFATYAYAIGEVLAQCIYAQKEALGARFEPLYIEMLKTTSAKTVEQLFKPFGFNPNTPEFWEKGLVSVFQPLLEELKMVLKN